MAETFSALARLERSMKAFRDARRLAEERPAADLHLGDKEAGRSRADDEIFQVAEVIGDEQPHGWAGVPSTR